MSFSTWISLFSSIHARVKERTKKKKKKKTLKKRKTKNSFIQNKSGAPPLLPAYSFFVRFSGRRRGDNRQNKTKKKKNPGKNAPAPEMMSTFWKTIPDESPVMTTFAAWPPPTGGLSPGLGVSNSSYPSQTTLLHVSISSPCMCCTHIISQ